MGRSPAPAADTRPVLILGAGINGAALARELACLGISTLVVDVGDLARGATAYSSRLIHGGLRYLEYGEVGLVRESLAERNRLVRVAGHHVRPLRLHVPVENRFGGFVQAAGRLLHVPAWSGGPPAARGLWTVGTGLSLYDGLAAGDGWPRHTTQRSEAVETPRVDARRYPWLCTFFDAQVRYPERFVVSLLTDAVEAAAERGATCELLTRHRAVPRGGAGEIEIVTAGDVADVGRVGEPVRVVRPRAVLNATGAWVDEAVRSLRVESPRLMGGTKGSHFVTWHAGLRAALGTDGLYGEAADGRPVFVLPFGEATLVGTTDERYSGDPADATASDAELDYLLATVERLVPSAPLARDDVTLTYAGVRPLPFVPAGATSAITRRHFVHRHAAAPWPLWSIVGGKLTTCRSLAEEAARQVGASLGVPVAPQTRDRVLPGSEGRAGTATDVEPWRAWAAAAGCDPATAAALDELFGSRAAQVFASLSPAERTPLDGTAVPRGTVRWVVEREWARRLDDLVERRLMLLYHRRLTRRCLVEAAEELVLAGVLPAERLGAEVDATIARLDRHFRRRVEP